MRKTALDEPHKCSYIGPNSDQNRIDLNQNWTNSRILKALRAHGTSLRALSLLHGYHPDSLRQALLRPYPKAERLIAEAIGVAPWQIWPSRYDAQGQPNRPYGRPKKSVRKGQARQGVSGGEGEEGGDKSPDS